MSESQLYTEVFEGVAAAEAAARHHAAELAAIRDRLTVLAATPLPQPRPGLPLGGNGPAEVIHDKAAQQIRIEQLQREARVEVLMFVRPPYVTESGNHIQEERLAAGISYRCLYESSALTDPGSADLPGFIAPGEQARATPRVPLKLMIVDGRHAMVPLASGASDFASAGLLLLHRSVLLDALVELFEERWMRGTPLNIEFGGPADGDSPAPALDAQLLTLLLSGLPDKAIASQLHVSLRTLQRRIHALMVSTGTANRTQLAWYVAQQRLA